MRQLNDKLVEVNTSKMTLQMKLDELEAAEINIKVSYFCLFVVKVTLTDLTFLHFCCICDPAISVQGEAYGTREGASS